MLIYMPPFKRHNFPTEKDFRIWKYEMGNEMANSLLAVKHRRQSMKQLELAALGLPPQPPPEKQSRKKRTETPKRSKDDRAKSAPKPRTAFSDAELDKKMQGQTWRAHDTIKGWRTEALSHVAKAEQAAVAAAEAAVNARLGLVHSYTNEGETALNTATEASNRAEENLRSKSEYASRFQSEVRMRAKLAARAEEARKLADEARKLADEARKKSATKGGLRRTKKHTKSNKNTRKRR